MGTHNRTAPKPVAVTWNGVTYNMVPGSRGIDIGQRGDDCTEKDGRFVATYASAERFQGQLHGKFGDPFWKVYLWHRMVKCRPTVIGYFADQDSVDRWMANNVRIERPTVGS